METKLKKCPCGQIPKKLFIEAGDSPYAYCYGDCCGDWHKDFKTVKHSVFTEASYAEAVKAWNEAPREEKP